MKDRKASIDFRSRGEVLITSDGETHVFHCELPARKPLTDYQIRQIDELVWKELTYEEKTFGQFALKMARAIERAHGIGEE